ncbi:uncharacterized protein LOC123704881 [Colias croceus]|uniref:uncharacterized protein LOC123701163 n=1 Tax=Colias crocea TaxID=72248 RepID=UPI001E27D9F5|nr:uncharacterized protein LOC123701163 [Colias croceus]XP_045509332.1 uncharacterized protein LOC123704881 [Colias croceus]
MSRLTRSPPGGELQHALSDTDVNKIATNAPATLFVSQRLKRQRQPSEDNFLAFKEEMIKMLADWKDKQTSLMNTLITEITDIKTQNAGIKQTNEEIQKSLTFLSDQYDSMKQAVDDLTKERKQHLSYIASLETKIEDIERNLKASVIEIRNIPVPAERETKTDLCNIVQKTCKALAINVQKSDIRDTYRVNGKSNKGTIVAELASVIMKNDILEALKSFKKQHADQRLNTTIIGLNGPNTPIYVSEALTNKGRRLFFLARAFAKAHDYKFCWSNYGRIFLRKNADSPHTEIKDEAQLTALRNQM